MKVVGLRQREFENSRGTTGIGSLIHLIFSYLNQPTFLVQLEFFRSFW